MRWQQEWRRLLLWVLACTLGGLILGQWLSGLLLGFASYALWTLRHLRLLDTWLYHGARSDPPYGGGLWGELFDELHRRQREERREREHWKSAFEHWQQAFQALDDAVVMLDAEGLIRWFNPAAGRLLGLRVDRDEGLPLTNLLRAPAFVAYLEAHGEDPLKLVSPADPRWMLELRLTRFGKRDAILFARDVTRIHKLEVMRKDFVANVSHELKTPLTVIGGYVETLGLSPLGQDERWQKVLSQMQAQSQRMNRLLDDLLTLSKLESLPRAENAPVELLPFLNSIASELHAGFQRKITVRSTLAAASIHGNAAELHSAFANLMSNACKYTPPTATIEVVISPVADGGLCVSVCDTGPGIAPRHLERLTERFYRVDEARDTASGGTGLGLAIVKHVLMRHDAHLQIDSRLGEGSAFRCLFPADRVVV